MRERPDAWTPWRESREALERRHLGREAETTVLEVALRDFARGGRPLPVYVFGPRGCGKSHLLALVLARLKGELDRRGVAIVLLPEDIPEQRTAAGLLERLDARSGRPTWTRWGGHGQLRPPARLPRRRVAMVDGLDRHLEGMGQEERRRLRYLLDERADLYLVGTGVTLGEALTGRDEAFFGTFDPRPLEPLSDADAAALLDRVRGEPEDARWPARRAALVALAGGSPRALVALAWACRELDQASSTEGLFQVVQDFTAHYQMRFRDLPPQGQAVVERLSEAPRELGPTELAQGLGWRPASATVVVRRLEADGILQSRPSGRNTFYRLTEPLFRYWLEYRTAPAEETRVGWLGRLLELLLAPEELARTWWTDPDETVRRAAAEALARGDEGLTAAWGQVHGQVVSALEREDEPGALDALERTTDLRPGNGSVLTKLVIDLVWRHRIPALLASLERRLRTWGWRGLAAALRFSNQIRGGTSPSPAFRSFLRDARRPLAAHESDFWQWWLADRVVTHALEPQETRAGAPWKFTPEEQRRLARLPVLRARFFVRGKRRGDAPLLDDAVWRRTQLQPSDPDLDELLSAAMVRMDSHLFEDVVAVMADASWASLPVCPRPGRPAPAGAEALALLAARRPQPELVTWAATLAHASEPAYERVLEAVAGQELSPDATPVEAAETALTALALHDCGRFTRLADALGPAWAPTAYRADLLAGQLSEHEHGPLHPELREALRPR